MAKQPLPMATMPTGPTCLLDDDARTQRRDALRSSLFAHVTAHEELPDGVRYQFRGEDVVLAELLEFVRTEHTCCTFFAITLDISPADGPIWLTLRGPEGVKPFLREMFGGAVSPVAGG